MHTNVCMCVCVVCMCVCTLYYDIFMFVIIAELATSVEHRVPLRDFDASNEADGEFKKINTLGHFHLHVLVSKILLLRNILVVGS